MSTTPSENLISERAKSLAKSIYFGCITEIAPSDCKRMEQIICDHLTALTRDIYNAIKDVDGAGAHPLLTEAVVLLGKAKEKVADFVELSENQP